MAGDWALGPGLYYVSPLYIYFLAVIGGITKSLTAVRVVQVLLGTLALGMLMITARAWFGSRAAWLAGACGALTGLFTFYEVVLMQAALDPFLTAGALLLLTVALHRRTGRGLSPRARRSESTLSTGPTCSPRPRALCCCSPPDAAGPPRCCWRPVWLLAWHPSRFGIWPSLTNGRSCRPMAV